MCHASLWAACHVFPKGRGPYRSHICVCQSYLSFSHEAYYHWFPLCSWSSVQEVAMCLLCWYFQPTRWLSHKALTSPSVFKSSLQDWHPWWKLNLVRAWKKNPLTHWPVYNIVNDKGNNMDSFFHLFCKPNNISFLDVIW